VNSEFFLYLDKEKPTKPFSLFPRDLKRTKLVSPAVLLQKFLETTGHKKRKNTEALLVAEHKKQQIEGRGQI